MTISIVEGYPLYSSLHQSEPRVTKVYGYETKPLKRICVYTKWTFLLISTSSFPPMSKRCNKRCRSSSSSSMTHLKVYDTLHESKYKSRLRVSSVVLRVKCLLFSTQTFYFILPSSFFKLFIISKLKIVSCRLRVCIQEIVVKKRKNSRYKQEIRKQEKISISK